MNALLMNTHNICFPWEIRKISIDTFGLEKASYQELCSNFKTSAISRWRVPIIRVNAVSSSRHWSLIMQSRFTEDLIGRSWLPSRVGSKSACTPRSHQFNFQLDHITFIKTDNEILSMVILPLQLIQGRAVISYWWKNVHKYWLTSYLED